MNIKRSVKFLLHTRKKGDATNGTNLAIRMRVTYGGNTPLDFPLGYHIDASDWDTEKERPKINPKNKNDLNIANINRTIDEYRSYINEVFARYELLEKRKPLVGEVKDLFNDMIGKNKIIDVLEKECEFFKVYDEFVKTMGMQNHWTRGTFQKFGAIRGHLEDFDKKLNFHSLNEDKMNAYVRFLLKKEMRNTTIQKNLSFLRWFLRWASHKNYYHGKLHETFRPKLKGTDGNSKEVIYLSQSEMKQLQEYTISESKAYLQRVRDVFLFTCFTGLRYSDVAKLTWQDVKNNTIEIVTQKTADGVRIELNKFSQALLDKYDTKGKTGKIFPVISNQKMNEYLKELGQLCGLNEPQRIVYFKGSERIEEVYPKWQLLTTHCGRRTFVVNALRLGIPSEVIIRWTGHADYKAMQPYVKIVDDLKREEMTKFDNLL
ncbi:site-specific integrase [Capnocytophaga canis]|uniref:site-specific integrase n=1 Tax=Capnocytophaga canis TaxID=1848903 RepID=UPI0037D0DE16